MFLSFDVTPGQKGARLLFLLRRKVHYHLFAFLFGQLIDFAVFFQIRCKTQKKYLPLVFIYYRTAFKEHVSLDFRTFLKETNGVFLLKIVIVLVRLRSETYFLYNHLGSIGLEGFLLFFLFVKELSLLDDTAYGRLGIGGYFHQIGFLFARYAQSLFYRVHARFDILTDKTHLLGLYQTVYTVLRRWFFYSAPAEIRGPSVN